MILGIIGTIIFGAVIGILARLVLPGKQHISVLMTVVLGVLGALVGYWIWGAPKDDGSIDWLRWITSVIAAALFVVIYERITARRSVTH
ncbi:GlsB/YeaQ/YmgE family stress response membrane protein [Phycicoccus flavus]|uniref:GlsB/YeaQ/YmgE family stress response membrane protein n=1 Tax=Phycicoccus flavus TaxID=2502783 RepID=UPI000FEBABE1|nr:GlsB/YeaQ/YmgE family stress response membrane protein [Phycicoccus flavus]NHA66927.1 GlsB/YeaQ/YmgE family stress response membrane protein [Phycicoccus flavus]